MSKIERLILRFHSKPKDFTFSELKTILSFWGYDEIQGSGSRVCFKSKSHKIKLHKHHPGNLLKSYQIVLVIEELKKQDLI